MARPIVSVFGSSSTQPSDPGYREAVRLGDRLARSGYDVATGGYGGTMEAVSLGATRAGGGAIGVTAPSLFPQRTGANEFVTKEEPAVTLAGRIDVLLGISVATITLPGSIGTCTELMVAWNEQYIRQFRGEPALPVLAIGDPWMDLVPKIAAATGSDLSLVTLLASVDAAFEHLG